MNTISTHVHQAPTYSSDPCWRAYAIINGRNTSICCMHSHKRQDLAERCATRAFQQHLQPLPTAELVQINSAGLMEARWTDDQNRSVTRRFYFLPTY